MSYDYNIEIFSRNYCCWQTFNYFRNVILRRYFSHVKITSLLPNLQTFLVNWTSNTNEKGVVASAAQTSIAPLRSKTMQILNCYCFHITHYFLNLLPSDLQIVQLRETWLKSASSMNKRNKKYYQN